MPTPEYPDALDRLRAARPEIDDALLAPDSHDAQALMNAIVTGPVADPGSRPAPAIPITRSRRPRGLVAAVASAAAIAIAIGAVATTRDGGHSSTLAVGSSGPTTIAPVALANIRTVAARTHTALEGTGRARITFSSGGQVTQTGTTDLSFAGQNVGMTIHFAGAGGEPGFDTTNRTVDGQFYLFTPGPDNVTRWYHDTNSNGSSVFDSDPRTLLSALVPEAAFVTVGNDTVDGVAVTHLRATKLDTLPALNLSLGPIDARDAKTLDVWVDSNDVVRRLDITTEQRVQVIDPKFAPKLEKHADGTIRIIKANGETITASVNDLAAIMKQFPQVTRTYRSSYSVSFYDIGAPITIGVPPGAVDIAAKG